MSQVWASGDHTELAALYHTVCRLMAIAIIPLGLTMAFFAPEALLCWTRSPLMVENTTSLVRLLAVGNVCLALTIVPYALQLASGWTGLAFWSNLVAAALLVPLMAVLASRYGTLGGGIAWTALNASYLVVTVALMHRKLLPGHLRHWALSDVGQPLLAVALTLSVARVLLPHVQSPLNALMAIGFAYAFAQLASVIASPLRPQIAGRLKSISIGAKG